MEKFYPDPEAIAQLRKLVAAHGGSYLPEPSRERHCDDCTGWAVSFGFGALCLCARCWLRRDGVAKRLQAEASQALAGQPRK